MKWTSITPPISTTNVACRLSFRRSQPDIEGFLRVLQFPLSLKSTPVWSVCLSMAIWFPPTTVPLTKFKNLKYHPDSPSTRTTWVQSLTRRHILGEFIGLRVISPSLSSEYIFCHQMFGFTFSPTRHHRSFFRNYYTFHWPVKCFSLEYD